MCFPESRVGACGAVSALSASLDTVTFLTTGEAALLSELLQRIANDA